MDGIYLRRNWGGEYENAAVLVAIAVNEDGYREVLGAAEGMKEDKASWVSFFQWLRGRGLDGVKLVAKMLKAIHAQESKKAAREKARPCLKIGGIPDWGRFFCQARRFDAGILTDFKSNQRSPGGKRCPKTAFCHVSNKA